MGRALVERMLSPKSGRDTVTIKTKEEKQ